MTRVRRWTRGNRWKKSGPFAIPLRHWVFRRSEEHTSELQSRLHLVCRLLLEKKNPDDATQLPGAPLTAYCRRDHALTWFGRTVVFVAHCLISIPKAFSAVATAPAVRPQVFMA